MNQQPKIILGGDMRYAFENARGRASGGIMIDGQHVADTLQCVHCQHTWIPIRGSGKERGFCMRCHGPTCGTKECDRCVPFELKLELEEAGLNWRAVDNL